jgi:D-aspartate ligase
MKADLSRITQQDREPEQHCFVDARLGEQRTKTADRRSASIARGPRSAAAREMNRPPVVILNMFYSGLGIARDMAGRKVRVVGLSAHPNIYGNFTRLCEVRAAPNSYEEPEALAEYLLSAVPELGGAVIFPTRDFDVLFLERFRAELEPHYRLAIPPRECLTQALDKAAVAAAAQRAGVPTPRTLVARDAKELERLRDQIPFPCVVKPVRSAHWHERDNWRRVGGRKAFLVHSLEQLLGEYHQVSLAHPEVLLQEQIPGATRNIVVLGAYVGENSKPLAWFTARKVVQEPTDFGTGCVVRSEEIPELLAPTKRLWRALQYQGMAEVEYKYDARTGEYRLIEMNTRHWDQHELGRASGVNLTWTAYCHLTGRPVPNHARRASPGVWIAEDTLVLHLLRNAYRRRVPLWPLLKQLSRGRIYGIFSWRDPWPLARYLLNAALSAGREMAGKLFAREKESGGSISSSSH